MDRHLLRALTGLFEGLPHVMFCVKHTDGRYVAVNQAFADRVDKRSPADVIDLRARDLFPPHLAATYEAQDRAVASDGTPLLGHLELVLRPHGETGWYLTNKVLLGEAGSRNARILSVSVDLEAATAGGTTAESLKAVVDHVKAHFSEALQVSDLAEVTGLTSSQLERRMKRVFGMSAKQYLLRVRLQEAVRLLIDTDTPINEIAINCGYYDQSSLTRHIKRATGVTPRQLRVGFREAISSE